MGDERPALTDRLAHLTPQERERDSVTVVLCELVDELVMATRQQTLLLTQVMGRFTAVNAGQNRGAGSDAGAAAPRGSKGDDKGGADVQLREPGVPPVDPDPAPGGDRPLAEPSAEPAKTSRRTAAKTTTAAKKTTAKASPSARPDDASK